MIFDNNRQSVQKILFTIQISRYNVVTLDAIVLQITTHWTTASTWIIDVAQLMQLCF